MRHNFRYFYSYMMDIYALTDDAIMRQIGSKLKELRIIKGMKQSELSVASGVSVFTISAVENGKSTSMLTIVQILRALEDLDYLNQFFQQQEISPIAYAKLMEKNKLKERVKSSKSKAKKVELNNDEVW